MLWFLLFLLFVLIIYMFGKNQTLSNEHNQSTLVTSKATRKSVAEDTLYKTKGIREFEMKGMFYRNLSHDEYREFTGYAETEDNKHDKYAVAIYDSKNKHQGYVSRGHKRLADSLNAWHNGKVLCWGHVGYDKYSNNWFGWVSIPVGLEEIRIKEIKGAFELQERNAAILSNKNLLVPQSFQVLINQEKMKRISDNLGNPRGVYRALPALFLTQLSMKLEKLRDYDSLIQLEQYLHLNEDVDVRYKNAINKRIKKAKENKGSQKVNT